MTDPDDITAWLRLDESVTTSGNLTREDIARLAALGVRHVINLAPDDADKALADEAALLAEQGIGYTQIPVPFDAPAKAHYDAFASAYASAPRPVHVHCMANMRVSAFLYVWHRDRAKMDEAEARELMHHIWAPDQSDHPLMRTWAEFIEGVRG